MEEKRKKALQLLNDWLIDLEKQNQKTEESLKEKNSGPQNDEEINNYPMVLTAKEVSEILKVSKPTAYQIMSSNNFRLIQIGRSKRVLRDEFFQWLTSKKET